MLNMALFSTLFHDIGSTRWDWRWWSAAARIYNYMLNMALFSTLFHYIGSTRWDWRWWPAAARPREKCSARRDDCAWRWTPASHPREKCAATRDCHDWRWPRATRPRKKCAYRSDGRYRCAVDDWWQRDEFVLRHIAQRYWRHTPHRRRVRIYFLFIILSFLNVGFAEAGRFHLHTYTETHDMKASTKQFSYSCSNPYLINTYTEI